MPTFYFCSTNLPLASTRWEWSTIKLCTVHCPSSAWSISSATSEHWSRDSNQRPLVVKRKRYLCATRPPNFMRSLSQRFCLRLSLRSTPRPDFFSLSWVSNNRCLPWVVQRSKLKTMRHSNRCNCVGGCPQEFFFFLIFFLTFFCCTACQ